MFRNFEVNLSRKIALDDLGLIHYSIFVLFTFISKLFKNIYNASRLSSIELDVDSCAVDTSLTNLFSKKIFHFKYLSNTTVVRSNWDFSLHLTNHA